MNIKIGEIIKKLRKERDVTQEKLADYLGISYQAVSKWENGTALPDITLVVPLANFFGVSTDELFSLNEQITNEKIIEYLEKGKKLFSLGDMQSCIELMRKALEEYPRNYDFMLYLARAIQWKQLNDTNKDCDEIIKLCERILEDCTNNNTRHETMQVLCTAYKDAGQNDKAIKTAKEMPSFSASSGWLLSMLYEGDERIAQKQQNILFYINFAAHELSELSDLSDNVSIDNFNLDEVNISIKHLEAALILYETIFYDGNALYYHIWIVNIYYKLAFRYMLKDTKKDTEKAMEYLLMLEKNAVAFDSITDEPVYYTSVFVSKMSHSMANIAKNYTESKCEQYSKHLEALIFEPLFDNPEFIALKERLANKKQN